MRFKVEISGDLAGVLKLPRVIEIASARAIDDTGAFAQMEIIRELEDELIIRNSWLKPKTRFGINFIPTQKGNLKGELFTRADWLLEEEGFNLGVKVPDKGGKHLAEPDIENTRHGIRNKVRQAEKARRLLQFSAGKSSNLATRKLVGATGAFKVTTKAGREIILQRVAADKTGAVKRGKRGNPLRSRGRNPNIIFKYALRARVKVPRTMIFQKTAISTYRVWYGTNLTRNLRKGLNLANAVKVK